MENSSTKTDQEPWVKRFYELTPDSQNALCLLAVFSASISRARLGETCGCIDKKPDSRFGSYYYPATLKQNAWKPHRVDNVIDNLKKARFIECSKDYVACKQELREKLVHHIVNSGQYEKYYELVRVLLSDYSYYSSRHNKHEIYPEGSNTRQLRHSLITDSVDDTRDFFLKSQYDYENYAFLHTVLTLSDPVDGWLKTTPAASRSVFLQYLLVDALTNLKPISLEHWELLLETVNHPKCDQKTQILFLDYALCAGKLDEIQRFALDTKLLAAIYEAHKAFLSGEYEKAAGFYHSARNCISGLKNNRNLPLYYLSGIFEALCNLHLGRVEGVKSVVKYITTQGYNTKNALIPINRQEAWDVIESIAVKLEALTPVRIDPKRLDSPTKRAKWLALLLYGHETIWFTYENKNIDDTKIPGLLLEVAKKTQTAFPWIFTEAAELANALGVGKTEKNEAAKWLESVNEFRKTTNSLSFGKLIEPKHDWEIWLNSLRSLVEPENADSQFSTQTPQKASRLVWRASFGGNQMSFTPYEQTLSPKMRNWTKGRPIALSRFYSSFHTLDWLTEQDRAACSHIKMHQSGSYYKTTEYRVEKEAARELVGHPLLFLENEPTVRIELFSAKPEIIIKKTGNQIHVSFFPPLIKYDKKYGSEQDDSDVDLHVFKETKTRYKVVSLTKKEQKFRKVLGPDGKIFPAEAESDLTRMLGKLAGDLTVKSDAKIEFENVPEVPAQTKLYLHLAPNEEGLQAEFFVRPLGPDGPSHRPGSGAERMIGEVNGLKLQAVRNLPGEMKKRDEIIARYPSFETASASSKDQYTFDTANDALALLSELENYKNENPEENQSEEDQSADKKSKTKKTTKKGAKTSIQSEELEILWPQGGNISVSSPASFGNLSLSFSSAQEWLSASGTLKVDKDAFDLQKLLEMLDEDTENRFIKISDRKFLALTNEFRKRLGDLKRISQSKGKQVQLHPLAAIGLEDFFDAVPSLQKSAVWKNVQKRVEQARSFKPVLPKDFMGELRDYQLDGFFWLARSAEWGVGCCLADDMGLGKTVQALALLLQRASLGPALIVAPTSVCFNWERETERFAPTLNIRRVQSLGPGSAATKKEREELILSAKKRDIVVTSYTLLQQEIELFAKVNFSTVILDEAQAIKNPDSNRAKAACRLKTDFRLAMTGTPIENNLVELWSLFRFLNPGLLGTQKTFEERFAVPIQRDHAVGPRNTLRRLMQPLILRRTKSQVLDELPPRTEILREIEMSREEAALYEAARISALEDLENSDDVDSGKGHLQILAALTRLRQLCCNPKLVLPKSDVESSKLEAFREIMQELQENRHKVLVFSQFVKHLEILKAELDKMGISYQYLDGSTPARERQKRVDAFQSGDYDAFLISIKAGGSGLNLTAADFVIHMDPWWNPAVEDQATDRTHRIGQTRPVTVYRLITRGTVEEKIVRLHHEKRDIADKLLEGTDQASKLTAEQLIDILRS